MNEEEEYDEFGNPIISAPLINEKGTAEEDFFHDEVEVEELARGLYNVGVEDKLRVEENPFGEGVEIVAQKAPQFDASDHQLVVPQHEKGVAPLLLEARKGKEESDFLTFLMTTPSRHRSVAIIGNIHHGKTLLTRALLGTGEALVSQRPDESLRQISLKANMVSSVVKGSGPSRLLSVIDTPGHPDFLDEVAASLRIVDAVLLCVDVAEGLHPHVERLIRLSVKEQLKIILVLSKIDRLVLELRVSPRDAYSKLKFLIDSVNSQIVAAGGGVGTSTPIVHPPEGTVLFSSEKVGLFFSLTTFAASQYTGFDVDPFDLAQYLWGPVYFDGTEFLTHTGSSSSSRPADSFVTFVMEPIYKVLLHSLAGEGSKTLNPSIDAMPTSGEHAMKDAVRTIFGDRTVHAVDALFAEHVLPLSSTRNEQLKRMYDIDEVAGENSHQFAAVTTLLRCNGRESDVLAYSRVIQGALPASGNPAGGGLIEVEVTNKAPLNALAKPEDSSVGSVTMRTTTGIVTLTKSIPSGIIVHLSGGQLGHVIEKHAVIRSKSFQSRKVPTIHALNFPRPLLKIAIEPQGPATNSLLQEGLRRLSRTFPGCEISRNEHNSEPILAGYGELYLDVLLHDLRVIYCNQSLLKAASMEYASANPKHTNGMKTSAPRIKMAIPYVTFSESVDEKQGPLVTYPPEVAKDSAVPHPQISMTASALDSKTVDWFAKGLVQELQEVTSTPASAPEAYKINWKDDKTRKHIEKRLRYDFDWDILAARSIMCLSDGSSTEGGGTNVLVDDSHWKDKAPESWKNVIRDVFPQIVASGPLCGEALRGVKFTITHIKGFPAKATSSNVDERKILVEVSNAMKSACRESFLAANPTILEPVASYDVFADAESLQTIESIVQARRGGCQSKSQPGTQLTILKVTIPLVETFGFEVEIRTKTSGGKAFPLGVFDHWSVVPGDPFDSSVTLGTGQPAQGFELARDFVMKTRRKKGLPENI